MHHDCLLTKPVCLVVIGFVQLMGRLGNTFNDIKWPDSVLNVGNIIEIINIDPVILSSATQCIMGVEPSFYHSFVFSLFLPMGLLASIVLYTISWQRKYKSVILDLKRQQADLEEAGIDDSVMPSGDAAVTTSGSATGVASGKGAGGGPDDFGGQEEELDIETIKGIIAEYDAGNKGFLTKEEFRMMLCDPDQDAEEALSDKQFEDTYAELDSDASGTLDFQELMAYFKSAQDEEKMSPLVLPGAAVEPVAEAGGFAITTQRAEGKGGKEAPKGLPLTSDEVEEYTAVFHQFDADQGGTLDPDELFKVIEEIDGEADAKAVQLVMDQIDNEGDRELDLQEFLTFMSVHKKQSADFFGTEIAKIEKAADDSYAKAWKNTLLTMFMVVPPTATKVVAFAQCDKFEGLNLLRADIRLVCYDETWWWYSPFFFAGFGTFIVGFPLFFFIMLYSNRKFILANPEDNSSATFRRLGFLYMAYSKCSVCLGCIMNCIVSPCLFSSSFPLTEPEAWWWDVFEIYRRLLLGLGVAFMGPGTWLQVNCSATQSPVCLDSELTLRSLSCRLADCLRHLPH